MGALEPLLLLIGGLVATVAALLTYVSVTAQTAYRRTVRARVTPTPPAEPTGSVLRERGSWVPALLRLPPTTEQRLTLELDRAGWRMRPGEFVTVRLCTTLSGVILALALPLRSVPDETGVRLILATMFGVLGWWLPRVYLARRRRARLQRVQEQLPDALMSVAKSLRAGTGLLQGLAYAAAETPAPLGTELQKALRDLQLGADADTAFGDLAARIDSPDLDIAVTAIVIQRSVGGNLSEILANVTETIRQRALLQREVRVWTTRQRVTSNLVAAMPVLIALFFVGFNPRMLELLTTTGPGRIALGVGVGFELLGIWMIRKLADIEV